MDDHQSIELNQVPIRWVLDEGRMSFFDIPAVTFWLNPSLLRILQPLREEVGDAMYRLMLAHQASLGTDEDYHQMVTQLGDNFEAGFLAWGKAVSAAGWGHFELLEFDPAKSVAVVRVSNPWELQMLESQPGADAWGCPFLMGKIIGIFSHALNTMCWADERHVNLEPGTSSIEFHIYATDITIAQALEKLRASRLSEREQQLVQEIERRKQSEAALRRSEQQFRDLASNFSVINGTAFFAKVSRYLSESLNMDYAFIGELVEDQSGVNVVGGYARGEPMALPYVYKLADTPCEHVAKKHLKIYLSGIQAQFPHNKILSEWEIDAYIGCPLFGHADQVLGIIVLMDSQPIAQPEHAESLLKIFSHRVAAELERQQADNKLKKSEMQYRTLFEASTDAIMVLDESGFIDCNQSTLDMFGWASRAEVSGHPAGFSPPVQPCGTDSRMLADEYIATAFRNGSHQFEWMHKRMNGDVFPAEVWLTAMELDGKPVLQATVRDITQRKENENHLEMSMQAGGLDFWEADLTTGEITRKAVKVFAELGYSAEEAVDCIDHLDQVVHPDDMPIVQAAIADHWSGKTDAYRCEFRTKSKRTNAWVWLANYGKIMGEHDETYGKHFTGVTFNIDNRKRQEEETKAINNTFRSLIDVADVSIVVHRNGRVLLANRYILKRMGIASLEALRNKDIMSFIHPDDREDAFQRMKQLVESGVEYHGASVRYLDAAQKYFEVEASSTQIQYKGEPAILTVSMDVTEKNKALRAVKKSESKLRRILDHLPDTYYQVDMDGVIQNISPAAYGLSGYRPEELIGTQIRNYYAQPETREDFLEALSASDTGTLAFEAEVLHKNGTCIWAATISQLLYDETGAVIGIEGTIRDITENRKRHELVRKLSSVIEQAGEAIIITNSGGIIEYANPAFTRITGYSAKEAIGQTPRLLKSGNQDAAFYEEMWKTITEGNIWHGKVIDRKKDGRFYPAMLTISPIKDGKGEITHYAGIQSDLSKLEDMEHRFHEAQKMEAVGTMVGGIAHNFNNMLAGMTGNLYLAKRQVRENPDVVQKLANVEELSQHAAEMIQQLLAFARQGVVSIKEMPLAPFIKETLKLLHASVPENIAVHENICSDDLQIKGDATLIHQMLANLVNNARDAVEDVDDPIIAIRLESFQADDTFVENHPYFEAGAYAHLSVEDNGVGIPEHQHEHLFEPFFTTKEQGKGTGLGLSMVYGAVKTHHGYVDVESIVGKGSSFHIYIPLLEKAALAAEPAQATEAAHGQGELILLADDEQVIRDVMAEILESFGYQVLLAEDGLKAMELFTAHKQEIALALLDVVMPHCGGMPLAKQIRAVNPDVPVIFLTGYDKEHVLQGEEPMPNSETLTKPVNFDRLSQQIRNMLD